MRASSHGSLSPRLVLILLLPPLAWAANAVVGRMAVGMVPPVLLNLLRWCVVALALLPLAYRALGQTERWRARAGYLALLGLLGMGCYNALQYMALHTSSPLNVTLIAASSPVGMLAVGALLFGTRPQPRQMLGALLSVAGVLLVISHGSWQRLMQVRLVPGDLLMLLAVLCWALYSWLLARPPAAVRDDPKPAWNWAESLLAQTVFGLGWCALSAGLEQAVAPMAWHWTPQLLGLVLFVGLVPGLAAYRAWGVGVSEVGPAVAAFFANLTPLFAALMSSALLGEAPQAHHIGAFALIVAGIAVSSRAPRRAPG